MDPTQMAAARKRRRPAFFWQGALILLPVAVLAVTSLIALRQDERAADVEARNRAVDDAQSLSQSLRVSVDEELQRFLTLQNEWMLGLDSASQASVKSEFPDARLRGEMEKWEGDYPGLRLADLALPQASISADGRPIEPPDFPAVPQPPKWFRDLTPEQAALWEELHRGRGRDAKSAGARQAAFLKSDPSDDARQAESCLEQPAESLAGHSTATPSETGIAYEEIACLQLLSQTNAQLSDVLLQSVWWRVMDHPSFLAPKLLELAADLTNRAPPALQQKFYWLRKYWDGRTNSVATLASLRHLPGLQPWQEHWWSHWTGDGAALAVFQPMTFANPGADGDGVSLAGHGYQIWFVPRAVLAAVFDRALRENETFVPSYARAELSVEGVRLPLFDSGDGIRSPEVLANVDQQTGGKFAQAAIGFNLKFWLTSRQQMLAAARRRTAMFGGLVGLAALTAFAGLFAARRAFQRQLQLNEQKSNFVSSVSHELRAPLASVRLMAENLEHGKVSGPARQGEYFRFIVQECRRLSSLIENVLDFSRIEQGRKQYEVEPTDVSALVETTVKLMEPYAVEKGVRLELNVALPVSRTELLLDGRAIQQALVNLIDNAVKHSPKGEVVTVGLERASNVPDAPQALQRGRLPEIFISVSDHGPGIPAAEHEKIFERFYRLGSELRRETQGVGIGLSVVKHIVEAHGGRIRVESEPEKGSRFTIALPPGDNRE